jgi:hypothetical protein
MAGFIKIQARRNYRTAVGIILNSLQNQLIVRRLQFQIIAFAITSEN